MAKDDDLIKYDDDEAVKYIQNSLPQDLKGKFSSDDINYVIDIIYDFYEEKGFMSDDMDENKSVEIDEDEIIEYVLKSVKKDKILRLEPDEITFIVQGELAYCDSVGLFE